MRFFKIIILGYLAITALGLLSQLQAQASAGDVLATLLFELGGKLFHTPEAFLLIVTTLLMMWAGNKK